MFERERERYTEREREYRRSVCLPVPYFMYVSLYTHKEAEYVGNVSFSKEYVSSVQKKLLRTYGSFKIIFDP